VNHAQQKEEIMFRKLFCSLILVVVLLGVFSQSVFAVSAERYEIITFRKCEFQSPFNNEEEVKTEAKQWLNSATHIRKVISHSLSFRGSCAIITIVS